MNWLFQKTTSEDAVFPVSKGWKSCLCLFYPQGNTSALFVVVFSRESEVVAFIPSIYNKERQVVVQLSPERIKRFLNDRLELEIDEFQLICLVSKKDQEKWSLLFHKKRSQLLLLVAGTEGIELIQGRFDNLRIEYRLKKTSANFEKIPLIIPGGLSQVNEEKDRYFFYQRLFHQINQEWFKGVKKINLVELLKVTIPFWDLYNKREKAENREILALELSECFKLYYLDLIQCQRIKNQNQLDYFIHLPKWDSGLITPKLWAKKQKQALRWLASKKEQISIDIEQIKN